MPPRSSHSGSGRCLARGHPLQHADPVAGHEEEPHDQGRGQGEGTADQDLLDPVRVVDHEAKAAAEVHGLGPGRGRGSLPFPRRYTRGAGGVNRQELTTTGPSFFC